MIGMGRTLASGFFAFEGMFFLQEPIFEASANFDRTSTIERSRRAGTKPGSAGGLRGGGFLCLDLLVLLEPKVRKELAFTTPISLCPAICVNLKQNHPGHWRKASFTFEQLDSQCRKRQAPTTPGCASVVGLPAAYGISPRRGLVPGYLI
ncbi:hypothetical protein [Cyclobacterium roseum]|uniref:hypothetical protein n=1 Tax=Cyclobacterium roseum TaxID=2666137 RepID=UPI001391E91F|nr:hypothetical protein [Cyclobacterium roseum]